MKIALALYKKYSPVFEKYSPASVSGDLLINYQNLLHIFLKSKMKFLKNHCLSKYVRDIESRGVVRGYTTNHSELQHKRDAKRPAMRTNFHKSDFASQVISKFIRFYERILISN